MILIKSFFWINKSIDNDENQEYMKIMKDQYNINCVQFKHVEVVIHHMMNTLRLINSINYFRKFIFNFYSSF